MKEAKQKLKAQFDKLIHEIERVEAGVMITDPKVLAHNFKSDLARITEIMADLNWQLYCDLCEVSEVANDLENMA